jgi:hypothetical protein
MRFGKQSVEAYWQLRLLIQAWRDDPERLAVAACAYEDVLGYASAANELQDIGIQEALALVDRARRGRHRAKLRARAEGLVLALEELAYGAEFARLHRARVESAVIECRELSMEERLAKLRAMEGSGVRAVH